MPLELTAEEEATIAAARAAKAKAAVVAEFDTSAEEETELDRSVPVPTRPVGKPTNVHSSYVERKAKSLGFSQADVSSMSEETLVARIEAIEQEQAREQRAAAQRRDAEAVARQQTKPPPPPKAAEEDVDISEYLDGQPESNFEPWLINVWKKQEKKRLRELAELKGELTAAKAERQQTKHEQINAFMDRMFNSLNREGLFGSGRFQEMVGTPAHRRRFAVFQEMAALGGVNEQNFHTAVETLYGKAKAKPSAPGEGEDEGGYQAALKSPPKRQPSRVAEVPTEEDFEEGQIARPTNRKGAAEVKGEKNAVSKLTARMREQGITDMDDEEGDIDGFLG